MSSATIDFALQQCPLFHGVSAAEREEIHGLFEHRRYQPGDVILKEGESVQLISILLKGRCQVVKSRKSGGEQELSVLEPCGVFGEMSFFHPAPHSASVRALTDVEVSGLSRERFDMLLRVGSIAAYKLAFNTVGVLADRLRKMDEWTCNLIESGNGASHRQEWHDFQSKLYSGWKF